MTNKYCSKYNKLTVATKPNIYVNLYANVLFVPRCIFMGHTRIGALVSFTGKPSTTNQWLWPLSGLVPVLAHRRPPHPDPKWKSFSYSPSLLLQLFHRFNLETLLPPLRPHRALRRRLLLMHRHSQQCPRMEMGWTLGSLASSSRSQSRSQCGDRSPSSKATDQQTLAAEEGDKLWRRRKRPAQTQGCDFFQAILFLRFLFAEIE